MRLRSRRARENSEVREWRQDQGVFRCVVHRQYLEDLQVVTMPEEGQEVRKILDIVQDHLFQHVSTPEQQ